MEEDELVRTTVDLTVTNVDKVFLSAASLDETPSEVVNRAIAFYYAIMDARPGTVIRWKFTDGSVGRLRR
jgi:plastocyanin